VNSRRPRRQGDAAGSQDARESTEFPTEVKNVLAMCDLECLHIGYTDDLIEVGYPLRDALFHLLRQRLVLNLQEQGMRPQPSQATLPEAFAPGHP
jgi:hypothetical protein